MAGLLWTCTRQPEQVGQRRQSESEGWMPYAGGGLHGYQKHAVGRSWLLSQGFPGKFRYDPCLLQGPHIDLKPEAGSTLVGLCIVKACQE